MLKHFLKFLEVVPNTPFKRSTEWPQTELKESDMTSTPQYSI